MKNLLLAIVAIASTLTFTSCSNNKSVDLASADSIKVAADSSIGSFGAVIDEAGAISVDSLQAMVTVNATEIPSIKVAGKVEAVCKKKGCWMELVKGDGSTMRVTFKDYAFFVPKNCDGKEAIVLGKAYVDTTSVADLRHFAEDEGLSKEEIEKINEPKLELAFEAEGLIIK